MQHPPLPRVSSLRQPTPASTTPDAGHSLSVNALDYELPDDRVATRPAEPRDSARMLVISRSDVSLIEHRTVRDLPEYLHAGDALVFNTTAVAPARLELRRTTGGLVEGLYLRTIDPIRSQSGRLDWCVMLRSGGRIAVGERLSFVDREDGHSEFELQVVGHDGDRWHVEIRRSDGAACSTGEVLDAVGRTPLPPYIRKARTEHHETYSYADDQLWYQTVFADHTLRESVAAPTAGLHFTPALLERLQSIGVQRVDITLHVGPGTFKPVTAATLDQHAMHAEEFKVPAESIAAIRSIRADSAGRVIAVGTTSVRALESIPTNAINTESSRPIRGSTDLMIAPPYEFRLVDGLLTNFHLPRSTLLALVAALVGLERLLDIYRTAIDRGYRFYSYGDAMLILP